MAPNQKKKKNLLSEAESGAIPWPDLPQQLTMLVGKQSQLLNNVSWGGVCKSWRTAPRRCSSGAKSPWLDLSEANDNVPVKMNDRPFHYLPSPHVLAIEGYPGSYHRFGRMGWSEPWNCFVGCSHGFIVTVSDPHNIDLFELHRCRPSVPQWDKEIPIICGTLCSSSRTSIHDSSLMVITGISNPAFVICIMDQFPQTWSQHDCTIIDPHHSEGLRKPMAFTNAVGFKGKFYALSSQGTLALIEQVQSQFRITGLGKNRAVPSVPCRHFREYLMNSNGQILLVFLISRKSINTIDDVEVFRLDLATLVWEKMENLGDRALFMGNKSCMSVTASQVGCKRNHVYFTHQTLDCWKEFAMANDRISPCYDSNGIQMKSPKWDQT